MQSQNQKHVFLAGGGEMGELIRSKNWSNTPLGDPADWPRSLQTMVGILLDNPFGMYIAWGKDFTQIYNDGYRPIMGDQKHPRALGISTEETFSEAWQTIKPMFEDVMRGNSVAFTDFLMPLNRKGYIENCYFDFAYSPIRLESGEVGGVLVTIAETTAKKKAEDELLENKKELEFVIEAAQLATFDYDPFTNKFSGNERLETWFGMDPDEEIDLNRALKKIASKDREPVAKAMADALVYESTGIYDVEYTIVDPLTKKEIIVHAKGKAWFNKNKIAYRLNGTLEDVTNRVLTRKKTEESERSLRLMILQAPVAIAIFRGKDYTIEIANKSALTIWGRSEEEVLDRNLFEVMPELVSQGIKEAINGVATTGIPYVVSELPLKFARNNILESVYVSFSFEALYDASNNINGIMVIGYNVTPQVEARKKVEESEQNMRALVESAPFPIGVFQGEDLKITLANQSIMDAWGKGSDVIGKSYVDILPELENQHIYEQIRSVLHTGVPFHGRNQRVDIEKNGKLEAFYFNYSFTPLKDASGNVHAVMNTAADLTELNRANHKIEESEKRFRDVVRQAPLGIVILRGSEHIVEVANVNYLQIIAKTEEDFIGKPLFETLPEVEVAIGKILSDIYETGEAFYGYEFPVILKRNGKTEQCYFNFVYHPLRENNVVTSIMVVATEVTATVKAKHQIEENEEKLELIIEGSELGIFDLDIKSGKITASDRCYIILGYSQKRNLPHKDLILNIHPEDLKKREIAHKNAIKQGYLDYQFRVLWEDKSVHWIDVKGKVFYDAEQNPERLLGTVRDITEEQTFQQQLLEREEKFRLLADAMPQQVWTSCPNGNLNYFNKTVFDYSGFTLEHLTNNGWLEMVHPDDRPENIKVWSYAVKTGNDFLLEHRFRKHTGEYRWQLSRAIPQKDCNGTIKMWVGSSTDIQEQKMFTTELENKVTQRTNELQQKNVDLEKMNKELQSFVYISSHDLQEPLRKIQTFSSRIIESEYEGLSETAKRYFSRMQKSAFRMQNLIQDLIAYSRTSVSETNFENVDLNEIIEDVKETLSEELEQNDVTFNLHDICEVKIISVQFTQVLHNLISNSIKFARENVPLVIDMHCSILQGKETGIEVLDNDTSYCHIRYADNGIGFEEQYQNKIFEVFQRLHSKDEYTGTGIGLAIVKRIIENHEGVIRASGNLNEGAVFDIYLPVE